MAEKKGFNIGELFEKAGIVKVFVMLFIVVLFFACIYLYLYDTENGLKAEKNISIWEKAGNSIYFSFITSTTAGYGDITPLGWARLIAIIEVIIGLVFLGLIISKLVSLKQEIILGEVYEISFEERFNRLRSTLFLFRTDLNKVIDLIESDKVSRRKISDLWMNFALFENTMDDIVKILIQAKKNENQKHSKKVDNVRIELISNSINSSLKKTVEIVTLLSTRDTKWKTKEALNSLNNIAKHCQKVKELHIENSSVTLKEKLNDMETLIKDLLYHIEDGKPKE